MDTILAEKVMQIYHSNGGRKRYAALKIAKWFGILQASRDYTARRAPMNEDEVREAASTIIAGLIVPEYRERAITAYIRAYRELWDAEDGSMGLPLFVRPLFGERVESSSLP